MIIDAHFHLGCYPSYYFYDTGIGSCLQRMDSLGIDICVNTSFRGLCGDLTGGVEESVNAFEESGGRIVSNFVFDPNCGSRSIAIMEKNHNRRIFKGIKLHPSFHSTYADDPAYEMGWQYASENRMPILAHTWVISATNASQKYSYPPRFEPYIKKYPDVTFICAHTGGCFDGVNQCVSLMKKHDNVFSDMAGDIYYNRLPEHLVKEVGAERILFGSDGFMFDSRTQLGMILGSNITLEDKKKILYSNALRIYGLSDQEKPYE